MITLVTPFWSSSQRSAACATVHPRSAAISRSRSISA
jgi:hypothetical protein